MTDAPYRTDVRKIINMIDADIARAEPDDHAYKNCLHAAARVLERYLRDESSE